MSARTSVLHFSLAHQHAANSVVFFFSYYLNATIYIIIIIIIIVMRFFVSSIFLSPNLLKFYYHRKSNYAFDLEAFRPIFVICHLLSLSLFVFMIFVYKDLVQ